MSRLATKLSSLLLLLLTFAIPIEHKYDKLFRFYSLSLIPSGLTLPKEFDKKIYFYASDVAALLLFIIALALFSRRRALLEGGTLFLWTIFSCALLSIVSSPLSNYPIAYVRLLQLLTPICLFSFLANTSSRKLTYPIFWALLFAALLQSAVAIAQYFLKAPLGLRLLSEPSLATATIPTADGSRWLFDRLFHWKSTQLFLFRPSGTLPHANVLGGFLMAALLASYALIVKIKRRILRPLLFLSIPLLFFAMSLTFSRSALFGWALGTALWFFLYGIKRIFHDRLVQALLITITLSVLGSGVLLFDQIRHRGGVIGSSSISQGSNQLRLTYQKTAVDLIARHPITGVGYQQYSYRANTAAPHNIFLLLAAETGLLSLAAFLAFLGYLFYRALQAPKTVELSALLAILAALLFVGCCDFYPLLFQQGKLLLFSVAGLLAAALPRKEQLAPPRKEVWKMFDQISSTYDRVNRILSLGMDRRWRKKLASHLPPKKELVLLDLATGTGDQLFSLFEAGLPIHSAVGIDLSQEMLEIAKEKNTFHNIVWMHADAEKLPLQNSSFDAATFSFGIRNVTRPLTSLKEIHRVLKPQGRALILEFSLPKQPIRPFYLLYLRHLLPHIGGAISKAPAAYRYLNETIETFPYGKAFCALLKEAGFAQIRSFPMALGAVTLYVGEKT